jgi:hypothetical protein
MITARNKPITLLPSALIPILIIRLITTSAATSTPTTPHVPPFNQERAYLLRSWQDSEGRWRFNLQAVGEKTKRVGFPTLDDLFQYLQSSLEGDSK